MKHLILAALGAAFILTACGSTPPAITTEYDKFKDISITQINPPVLIPYNAAFKYGSVHVTALYLCNGQTACAPDMIRMYFLRMGADWMWLKSHDVIFLVDGKRMQYETDAPNTDVGAGRVSETISFSLSLEDYKTIVNAGSCEVQIGPLPIAWQAGERIIFKQLAARF